MAKIIGPGFQGSDKSGVEVSFYSHGSDPIYNQNGIKGGIHLKGKGLTFEEDFTLDSASMVSNLSWTKSLGPASGNFSIDVKTRKPDVFLKGLMDDDWLDIVFTQHNRKYHVCRGLIDTIRENRGVNNGATEKTITITGRDFGKVWESTAIFFNIFIGLGVGGGSIINRFASNDSIYGNVERTINAFLFAFLQELGESERANARWAMPPGMPGISSRNPAIKFFRDCVLYNSDFYTDQPKRRAFHPGFIDPELWGSNTLWDFAKEWSDPFFCELFTDIVNSTTNLQPGADGQLLPDQSSMGVFVRDKPFLSSVTKDKNGNTLDMLQSPWFSLPLFTVVRQECGNDNLGRGGEERFNTIFVKNAATAEYSDNNIEISKPLWYPDDVVKRGIRRLDVTSNYHQADSDNLSMITTQRELLRDWYGLNPYFINGTLPLIHLRPDIRIGSRLRIPGRASDGDEDETYYIEGLTHQWSLGNGKTSLTLTRGWQGNDRSLIQAVSRLKSLYTLPDIPVDTISGDGFDPTKFLV